MEENVSRKELVELCKILKILVQEVDSIKVKIGMKSCSHQILDKKVYSYGASTVSGWESYTTRVCLQCNNLVNVPSKVM